VQARKFYDNKEGNDFQNFNPNKNPASMESGVVQKDFSGHP
jgi:hypothetical protein